VPQAVHAAIQFANDYPEEQGKWFKASNTVVVLETKDEQSLHKLTQKLDNNGLKYSKFFEPDIGNALTAIAIVPSPCAKRFCSNLPLAGKARSDG
jgi:peptidyl-tRNA hydrolase